MALTSVPPPLTLRQSLLLAQAVNTLGTSSWDDVSSLVIKSPYLHEAPTATADASNEVVPVELQSAEGCKKAWERLATEAEVLIDPKTVLEPKARPARKITRKLFSSLLLTTHAAVTACLAEEARLRHEIQLVNSGTQDDDLLGSLSPKSRQRFNAPSTVDRGGEDPKTEGEGSPDKKHGASKTKGPSSSTSSSKAVKKEEVEEEEDGGEASDDSSRKRAGRRSTKATSTGPRKSTRGRGTTKDEHEDSPEVEEETPAPEDDEEGEDEEDDGEEEEGGRSTRRSAGNKKGKSAVGRRSKRKTSEVASPGPSEDRSKKRVKAGDDADDTKAFRKSMNMLLDNLTNEAYTHPFKEPVLKRDAKTYYSAIKRPLSIVEIKKKLRLPEAYSNATEIARDVALLCANARQFNPSAVKDPDDIAGQAEQTWRKLEELMQLHMSNNS